MSEHTHDDCVQCLQKEVRRLQAAVDAAEQNAKDEAFEREQTQESLDRSWGALKKIGVISIEVDSGRPVFGLSPCCNAPCEINQDATRNCSKCSNAVA
jgi:hypothetical protein